MLGEGEAALDAVIDAGAVLQAEEALRRALAGQELVVALVDVRLVISLADFRHRCARR